MSKLARKHSSYRSTIDRSLYHSRLALSARACSAILAGTMLLGGGLAASLAYADGYVAPDGNIYYGYKSDANYSKDRIKIEVHYYSNMKDAEDDNIANQDPLGKFVHVKYTANLNSKDNSFDKWAFRPMWWYGVPAGLTDVHDINYSRFEKYTDTGAPAPSTPGIRKDSDNVTKHYANSKDWKGISNFYITDPAKLTSMNGLSTLLGIDGKRNNGYDNAGNTSGNWTEFYDATKGMQGMFIDWESAGKRFYQMTYVAELTEQAWKERDEHPLRFAAGVYRFAGNWHVATGQVHRAPKIGDSLKVAYPSLTPVAKADSLTPDEKTNVTAAIKKANESTKHFADLLEKIEVGKDGTATLTFHDKTTLTMPGNLLVVEEKKDNVKFPPVYPAPIGVVNPQKLSADDQKAIIAAFKKANDGKDFLKKVSDKDADVYKFDNTNQTLKINYQDGSSLTIPYDQLVYQGATIADWAPYVVPDPTEVANLTSLTTEEQGKVTAAFDEANKDLDVYTAAKKDGKTPVTFDKDFKNAIITWADGSQTQVPSWQFLKKKAETPTPNPQPPVPTPAEEKKMFTVDLPDAPAQVAFDPFDKNATVAPDLITSLQKQLKNRTAKDANDASKSVTITSATISIADGTVTFKANGYEDKVYPIGIFYKKKVTGSGTQNPTQQTPTSKTDIDPDEAKNTFTYNVRKIEIDGDKPNAQDAIKALKQFVTDNYDNVSVSDLQNVTSDVAVGANWKPKANTKNMGSYLASGDNAGPMSSFSIVGNDFGIKVTGHPWSDDDNGGDWSSEMTTTLFTIKPSDLYVKKGTQQTPTDNTVEKLKELAKQLRDQRKKAGELTEDAINTLGATDDKINGMTDENVLRDLIKKIADYQKPKPVEYKYNFEKLTLDHEGDLTDDDYKKIVVEQFLKKNYTTTDNTNWSKLEGAYNNKTIVLSGNNANTYGLTPVASGTSGLNIYTGDKQTGSVTSVIVDSQTGDLVVRGWKAGSTSTNAEELIRIKKADLFTPKPKDQTPAPTPQQLQQMKDDAKKLIDRNPKLTDDQKTDYKNQIDNADTKEKIQEILKKANEQADQNNVNHDDIKKKEKEEKEKREKEQKEKEDKKQEDQKNQELQDKKKKASDAIDGFGNLTNDEKKKLKDQINGNGTTENLNGVATPEEVQKILDDAKNLNEAREVVKVGELPFLSHGKGDKDVDDKALKELIGSDPSKKDAALTALEAALAKKDPAATADEIKNALNAAKRQNAINEENAKNAGLAKLDAKKAELDAAYNALAADQQAKAKEKYDAAINAINDAKSTVNNATKPSDIMTAVNGVDTSLNDAKEAIKNNTPKRDTTQNTYDDQSELDKEKEAQKKRIQDSDLPEADKKKAIDDINNAKKLGDPTGIANRALKAKKIEDALKALDEFEHLNNAQKDAFKAILKDTDASDHKNADGTTSDDIDDVLANAANTDNAMARLESLKIIADEFAKGEKYKGLQEGNEQKKAFDDASTAAGAVLDKAKGDAKGADEVNTLYNDLLKAMRAIDPDAKSAGLKTDALSKEIESDNKFKPSETDPTTNPGNSVYNTSSKAKKDEFDKALGEAQTVLNGAKTADISDADKEAAEQKEIDAALDKLIKARLALDGVNTDALQAEVTKDDSLSNDISYKNASQAKKDAFDKALKDAKDLVANINADSTKTKAEKQDAVDSALNALQTAAAALDGVDTKPLQDEVATADEVKKSDAYTYASQDKKDAYNHTLQQADKLLKELSDSSTDSRTKDQKEKALADALQLVKDTKAALDGKKPESPVTPETPETPIPSPVPTPTPTPAPAEHVEPAQPVKHATPKTSDPFALGQVLASLLGSAGILGAGLAGRSKRSSAKHMKRKK